MLRAQDNNLKSVATATPKADVYSFAIILHEIVMRKGPFWLGDDIHMDPKGRTKINIYNLCFPHCLPKMRACVAGLFPENYPFAKWSTYYVWKKQYFNCGIWHIGMTCQFVICVQCRYGKWRQMNILCRTPHMYYFVAVESGTGTQGEYQYLLSRFIICL